MLHKQKNIRLLSWIIGIGIFPFILMPVSPLLALPTISEAEKSVDVDRELSEKELEQIAAAISVKVTSKSNGGSGALIAKNNNIYTVLTNNHVVEKEQEISIQTNDGQTHQAELITINSGDKDIAILQFSSVNNYQVATLSNTRNVVQGDTLLISGFPFRDKVSESRELTFRNGRASFILQEALKAGYQIGYVTEENTVEKGMSGGAILDKSGKLIGINGIHANPLWGNPYVYENGDSPNEELRNKMSRSNWGVPVEILAEYAPNLALDISQSQQVSTNPESIETAATKTSDLANKIDAIAKEISVLISWETANGLSNGSGTLIAREDNTYSVLTAEHVISNANESLKIVTHDGREYQVQSKTTFDGADLALLQFTSNQPYQTATIGDYYRGQEDRVVFVSGWPGSKQTIAENLASNREFNAGYLLGYGSVNLARDNRSFNNGWELVYSNFTTIGMSGSPLLDIEGNLIGIHAGAESDQGRTSPVPQKNDREQIHDIGYSLGIPIRTFLAKVEQNQINLNLNPTEAAPQKLNDVRQDNIIRSLVDLTPPPADGDEVAWLNYGNKLWRLRDYEKSLLAYNRAIEIKPDFYKAWYAHGWALMRQENYTQAKASFTKAIKYIGESDYEAATIAWRQLGDAHYYLNDYQESIEAFKKAIYYRKDDFIVYQWLSESFKLLGRYQDAIKAVEESLSLNPNSAMGYARLASTLSWNGDNEAAISQMNKAIELEPGNAEHYVDRGQYSFQQKKYHKAIADFNKAIEIEPSHASAYARRGLVYANQGNKQKFDLDLNKALSLQPENDFIYGKRGDGYFALGEVDKGIKDYDTAISLSPELAHDYYNWRGIQFASLEKYDRAIADYNQAIRLKPNYAVYYQNRGNAYGKSGNIEQLVEDYDTAISLSPDSAHQYYNKRGVQFHNLEKYDRAIADYNQAIQLKPDDAIYYQNRGNAYGKSGNIEQLVEDYDTAISLSPDSAHQYYNKRGNQFASLEKYDRAIADHTQAIQLKPNIAKYYKDRGVAHGKAKNYQLSLLDFNRAIEIDPDNAALYENRGIVYKWQKEYESAIADFLKSIKIKPNNPSAYYQLGQIAYESKAYPEAINLFNQAIKLQPILTEKGFYHGWLGQAYYKQGEYQQAVENLSKAIKIVPEAPKIEDTYLIRAVSYNELGQYEAAVSDMTQSILINPTHPQIDSAYGLRGAYYEDFGKYQEALADYDKSVRINPENIISYEDRAKLREKLGDKQGAKEDWEKIAQLYEKEGDMKASQLALDKVQKLQ